MGSSQSVSSREHVLVVGGTGRTGRRLINQLCDDPRFEVTAVVRDRDKAQLVFGDRIGKIDLIEGDLTDVHTWQHRLKDVSQIVTAVSCGIRTDPYVVLGARASPSPLPHAVDADGIAQLAMAAKANGVRRFVCVTTASADTPWSPTAIFLNTCAYFAVKHKWQGEQAIRSSGLDYVILRPYGLGQDLPPPVPPLGTRGIEWAQSRTAGAPSRRIPRDDVARLCHEALLLPEPVRSTVEVWATEEHARPLDWNQLKPDPPGRLNEVNHDLPVAAALSGTALLYAGVLRGAWNVARYLRAAGRG